LLGCAAVCQYRHGSYLLQFARNQQYAYFKLTYNDYPLGQNAWTGVAFGESMYSGLDFIGVLIVNRKVLVFDEFVRGYSPPVVDTQQNVFVQSISLINGNLQVQFARPIISNDSADFSLAGCLFWQFPTTLSAVRSNGQIHKHVSIPQKMMICLDRCPCGPSSTAAQCQL
uniref:DOMON domain-containing protein n=1 Tax=Thelazia callipaeda TaxID=103827 RepID=A0A0N5D2W2_THECL